MNVSALPGSAQLSWPSLTRWWLAYCATYVACAAVLGYLADHVSTSTRSAWTPIVIGIACIVVCRQFAVIHKRQMLDSEMRVLILTCALAMIPLDLAAYYAHWHYATYDGIVLAFPVTWQPWAKLGGMGLDMILVWRLFRGPGQKTMLRYLNAKPAV